MKTKGATAEIFLTAFKTLPKTEQEIFLSKILRDRKIREDLIDIAIAENRAKDKSRPFRDFLQDHIDAVLIEKAKKVKGKAVSASEYFTKRRKTGQAV